MSSFINQIMSFNKAYNISWKLKTSKCSFGVAYMTSNIFINTGSGYGLLHFQCNAIALTNTDLLSIKTQRNKLQ